MCRVVIIGSGGHAREVAEILVHGVGLGPRFDILGFIDEDPAMFNRTRDGFPVLGDWSWFDGRTDDDLHLICAVGTPQITRRLVERAQTLRLPFVRAVSPLAHVSPHAIIGEGAILFPHVVVNTGARVGDHCTLNLSTTISHDASIGRYSNVNPGVHIAGGVRVEEECYIGMGASIIQYCSIGARSVVGAGAVVVGNLESDVTAVGVPARAIKRGGQRVDDDSSRD